MVPFQGRNSMKQYILGKPVKRDFRNVSSCNEVVQYKPLFIVVALSLPGNHEGEGVSAPLVRSLLCVKDENGSSYYVLCFLSAFSGFPGVQISGTAGEK
ncbi:unnamed protein product [Timema podura]|uniref:Uncharacterized protein n=1 Tax=Timema podura TaxID=61482 RepID=A0ABN7P380_TIMPD|nr:unnamed protein product [Timema podura]